MARNGTGTYVLPSNSWNPAIPDTTITAEDWNATADDLALALTQSIASTGETTTTQPIPFAQGLLASSGLLATPGIAFIGDANTGFYRPAADQLSGVCGGVAFMVATSTGVDFPLGVTFGALTVASLTVSGATTLNGAVTLGDAAGDAITVNGNTTFAGTAIFSGAVTLPNDTVANTKLANMATSTIKGRVTAGTGDPEDLTGAQATTILSNVVGATQSTAGTKGIVPQPAAAQQNYVLAGDGTFRANLGRAAGATITTTNVNGSQPTLSGAFNVASISTLTEGGSVSQATVTFTNAMPNALYQVCISTNGILATAFGTKTTTTLELFWANSGGQPTSIDFSVFAS